MATLYRCPQGHVWEDLLDTPTLVEGQVRCPVCGGASQPAPAALTAERPQSPAAAKSGCGPTLLSPVIGPAAPAGSTPGPTRLMAAPPATDPIVDDHTPPHSAAALATVVRPVLGSLPPTDHSHDLEVVTPPRGGPALPMDRTSEVEVAPFFPPPGELTRTADAAPPVRPVARSPVREERRPAAEAPSQAKARPAIPGYEILDELGRGGMGVVYKARQVRLNRLVALKMILAGSNADERERARFTTEAEAIARLQHPNIVQIFEVGEIDGSAWFSLEFVDGGSLADRLKGQALPVHESARLVETLARAVHFAHLHGVVHRDLKPANVLLQKEDDGSGERERAQKKAALSSSSSAVTAVAQLTPKITDFGLAKTLDQDIHHTRSGMVVGTPGYMAPEQATGTNVGPATDTYALGVILYQLVTGKLPFVGESPMEVMLKVTQQEPPRPRKWQPKLAADLETIILKCLEKDPRRRYASALELAEDLRRFLAHEPIQARPVPPLERAVRWVRRRPATAALVSALVLAGVGLLATLAWYERSEKARQARELREVELALTEARALVGTESTPTRDTWIRVHGLLEEPARRVRNNPFLADLAEVEQLLAKADGHLRADTTFTAFTRARDEVLFQATLASGTASEEHRNAIRRKVENALEVVGASATAGPQVDDFFSEAQKAEIARGVYELLLVLADTIAQPLRNDPPRKMADRARDALEVLKTADKLLPGGTHAYHLRKARFHDAAGSARMAAEARARAEEQPPRTDMDHYLAGSEHYRQGNVKGAEVDFVKALHKNPGHFWARFSLALCQVRQGQLIAARDNLTSCLARHPDELRIHLLRGFVLGQLQQFQEAAEDFKEAEAKLDPSTPGHQELRYALYNNRAVTHLGLGQFDQAIADLKKAEQIAPEHYQVYITLSQAYRKQGDAAAALKALNTGLEKAEALYKARALDVHTYMLLRRMRSALNVEGKNRKAALDELDRLVALQGLDKKAQARVLRDRGHLLYRDEKFDQALAAYNQSVNLDPGNIELQRWRGEVLLRVDPPQYQEAADAFSRYLENHKGPAELNVYRGRAFARLKLQQYTEAIGDFTQALSLKSADAANRSELHLQRGHAYFASSAWGPAAKDFEAALAGANVANTRAALQGLALCRLQQGQLDKAAEGAERLARTAAKPGAGGKPEDAWQPLYQAACILAQVAGQVDTSRDDGPTARRGAGRDKRRRYQDAALGLLRQALDAMPGESQGVFWRETVRNQPALQPLSSHEVYLRLEKKYSLH